ncbi:MAG: hypothetical protein WBA57_04180, partial [Elainellaceae cyanobacterium]
GVGDHSDEFQFVRDNFEGKELVLFASQMLALFVEQIIPSKPISILDVLDTIANNDITPCGPDCDCNNDSDLPDFSGDILVGEGGLA